MFGPDLFSLQVAKSCFNATIKIIEAAPSAVSQLLQVHALETITGFGKHRKSVDGSQEFTFSKLDDCSD
jgi:hypothetical protein